MITQRRQTDLTPATGTCFSTCVAMVLDVDQADVPHFCVLGDGWWQEFQRWLDERHQLFAVEVTIGEKVLASMTPGVPVILTGHSPTYPDKLHSVVGLTTAEGFEYLFDPNPCDKFLRDLVYVTFFAPLRPDRTRQGR